ncbi:Histidinol-phosphate aminotransferase [Chryseobacterium aquaeductus]|uniref:Histidinol-phosphate aminotransferase n=1 Tax=Chryseobacterium aquaeductus TaxID=2675056 RepID=A0A9N8MI42_9FLAO|nr:histidinol-phosphate transaminase [Chryseobacterium aquaeductus]CAA7332214.1 Histidinol-phosphate aminotransferase [Chryseobacterium potabilaquae]CAD7815217.1 Histidinol-phosphate aminotransferase [Chryseobacterium aquaeductus]
MTTTNIRKLVRKNILELQPYISFRDHNSFENAVLMDANESPFGEFNRYPDSTHRILREKISAFKNISFNQIAIANGSDELIELIIKIFCEPKKDSILVMNPSFAMYGFYAEINENKVVQLNLNDQFEIVKEEFLKIIRENNPKILFLCSPNNPTGNSINDIEFYIKNFDGIVVVDEAYIEFSEQKSCLELINEYQNLIVLQTFSKAWGLAGARVGIAFSSEEIINLIYTVKSPYNVNVLSQNLVLEKLNQIADFQNNLSEILQEKKWLNYQFENVECVSKVFPSDANFFLVEFKNAEKVYNKLTENEILTSKRFPQIPNCIRINVGNRTENETLIAILKNI